MTQPSGGRRIPRLASTLKSLAGQLYAAFVVCMLLHSRGLGIHQLCEEETTGMFMPALWSPKAFICCYNSNFHVFMC